MRSPRWCQHRRVHIISRVDLLRLLLDTVSRHYLIKVYCPPKQDQVLEIVILLLRNNSWFLEKRVSNLENNRRKVDNAKEAFVLKQQLGSSALDGDGVDDAQVVSAQARLREDV